MDEKGFPAAIRDRGAITSAASTVIDGIAITLSAILTTLPIIAYNFGTASLVGLPATLLALPVQPGIIFTTISVGIIDS